MKLNLDRSEVSLGTRSEGTQSRTTSWSLHGYKLCSLQKYIRHECCSEDLSSSNFLIRSFSIAYNLSCSSFFFLVIDYYFFKALSYSIFF
jgi:hypothetical protein